MKKEKTTIVAAGILIGVIVGCINGFGVAIMKAPSLIFTLGVNGILRGLMFIYTDGADVKTCGYISSCFY